MAFDWDMLDLSSVNDDESKIKGRGSVGSPLTGLYKTFCRSSRDHDKD